LAHPVEPRERWHMLQLDKGGITVFSLRCLYASTFNIFWDIWTSSLEMVKNSKCFRTFWPILTVLHQNVRRSVPYILTTFGNAEKNRNGSCPMHELDHPPNFWVFNSPPQPPGADGHQRGRGHGGRHCPYTNKIWCGSVQTLLRYRSKTTKIQKFPMTLIATKISFPPFPPPPPDAANP